MSNQLLIFLCLSSLHFLSSQVYASRLINKVHINNNDLTLLLNEYHKQSQAMVSGYSDDMQQKSHFYDTAYYYDVGTDKETDIAESGSSKNKKDIQKLQKELEAQKEKERILQQKVIKTKEQLAAMAEQDKEIQRKIQKKKVGDKVPQGEEEEEENDKKVPNFVINHKRIGACKGNTLHDKIYECKNPDQYEQCPPFQCKHGHNDGTCPRTHRHPVTRSLTKNTNGICSYVKHCDWPWELAEPNWKETGRVIKDVFTLHWNGQFFNAVKNVLVFESHKLAKTQLVISIDHKMHLLLNKFKPIKKKAEFGVKHLFNMLPQKVKDLWFNGYMSIGETILNKYLNGVELEHHVSSYQNKLRAEAHPLFKTPLLGAIAIGDKTIEFMLNAYKWAISQIYQRYVKKPLAKSQGANAEPYHAPKVGDSEKEKYVASKVGIETGKSENGFLRGWPFKNIGKAFAQNAFNTANDVMNNIANSVLDGVVAEYSVQFEEKLNEIAKKVDEKSEHVLEAIEEKSFVTTLKKLVAKFFKKPEQDVDDIIKEYKSIGMVEKVAEIGDKIVSDPVKVAAKKIKDLFAAAIYELRNKMQVFFRNAIHSLDNFIRRTINHLKSAYAAGNHLHYTAGMDLGLHVVPNCNPNERMTIDFKDSDAKKMLAKDVKNIEHIPKCPNPVTHRQVGECTKTKPAALFYHCQHVKVEDCPPYSHRLNKDYGENYYMVFINKMVEVERDFAVCTYVKECVRRSDNIKKGLLHAFEEEAGSKFIKYDVEGSDGVGVRKAEEQMEREEVHEKKDDDGLGPKKHRAKRERQVPKKEDEFMNSAF